MTSSHIRRLAVVAVTAALTTATLAGCEGGSRSGSDQPGAAVATPGAGALSSVNQASEKDLAATLRDTGVEDPAKWAQILVQYRPYPAGEAGTQAIRRVLDQFRADPETVAKITGSVTA